MGCAALATRRWGIGGGAAAAAIGAAVFNYVDLLTTPAVTWAYAAFIVAATIRAMGASLRRTGLALIGTAATWPAAYAFTWISKWLITAALLGSGSLAEVKRVAAFRLSGQYHGIVGEILGAASWRNLQYWLGRVATARFIIAVVFVCCLVAAFIVLRKHDWRSAGAIAMLASPAIIVPFWYEVMRNHSQIHAFFTYQSVPSALAIIIAAIVVATQSTITGGIDQSQPTSIPEATQDSTIKPT
jgi:hypothetical protein